MPDHLQATAGQALAEPRTAGEMGGARIFPPGPVLAFEYSNNTLDCPWRESTDVLSGYWRIHEVWSCPVKEKNAVERGQTGQHFAG